jgi:hypothetical protein
MAQVPCNFSSPLISKILKVQFSFLRQELKGHKFTDTNCNCFKVYGLVFVKFRKLWILGLQIGSVAQTRIFY